MESLKWDGLVWLLFPLGVLVLMQLAGILRSVQSTEAMMKRFLSHHGVEGEAAIEPSAKVKELALAKKTYIEAIKAYREQTGLGLKEAKAVIDARARAREGAA